MNVENKACQDIADDYIFNRYEPKEGFVRYRSDYTMTEKERLRLSAHRDYAYYCLSKISLYKEVLPLINRHLATIEGNCLWTGEFRLTSMETYLDLLLEYMKKGYSLNSECFYLYMDEHYYVHLYARLNKTQSYKPTFRDKFWLLQIRLMLFWW